MEQNTYIKSVIKKLKCSGKKKKDIAKQLQSDIGIAREEGRSLEEILAQMGSPSDLAEEFNENMPGEERKKAKRALIGKIAAVILIVLIILGALLFWWLPKGKPVEDSSRFDEEAVTARIKTIIQLLDEGDYAALQESYLSDVMKEYITKETMDAAKAQINEEWGAFVSFGNVYMVEISQMNEYSVVTEMTVSYENTSVVYRITLDEGLNVIGLYMR